jgi:hypothetical protein
VNLPDPRVSPLRNGRAKDSPCLLPDGARSRPRGDPDGGQGCCRSRVLLGLGRRTLRRPRPQPPSRGGAEFPAPPAAPKEAGGDARRRLRPRLPCFLLLPARGGSHGGPFDGFYSGDLRTAGLWRRGCTINSGVRDPACSERGGGGACVGGARVGGACVSWGWRGEVVLQGLSQVSGG